MKKKILIGLFNIFILIVFSCTNNKTDISIDTKTSNTKQIVKKDHISIEGLELNDGKKWKANPETTEGINHMIEIMSNLKENPTIEDYQNLGLELEKEKKYILNQCTMDGVAHDNLHKYLMPLIRRINGMKEVETIKKAERISNYINNHLAVYTDYFE